MYFVEIFKTERESQRVLATCRLQEGLVVCMGDEALVDSLMRNGIVNYAADEPPMLFPKDGIAFLQNLAPTFKSGYLMASAVQEAKE